MRRFCELCCGALMFTISLVVLYHTDFCNPGFWEQLFGILFFLVGGTVSLYSIICAEPEYRLSSNTCKY